MFGHAVGVIGVSADDYMNMTFAEYYAVVDAHVKRERRQYQGEWERARFVAYYAVAPHTGKKGLRPHDICRFDWERVDVEKLKKVDFDKIFPERVKKI